MYDGTNATKIDINVGAGSSFPKLLTDVGGTLYSSAYVPAYGDELWVLPVNDRPVGIALSTLTVRKMKRPARLSARSPRPIRMRATRSPMPWSRAKAMRTTGRS